MVKRFPHTATITHETNGSLVGGEWVDGEKGTTNIIGRYDPSYDSRVFRKRNALGDEIQVQGYFYTKQKPINGAQRISIPALNIDTDIISWEEYQTHNVISI